jgi:hypothetical protein
MNTIIYFSTDTYIFGAMFILVLLFLIFIIGSKNYMPKKYSKRDAEDLFYEGSRHLLNDDPHNTEDLD